MGSFESAHVSGLKNLDRNLKNYKLSHFALRGTHHDAVGLADGPDVDPAVLSSCGQQAARAFPQSQTGNGAGVSLELLCTATKEEQIQVGLGCWTGRV